MSISFQNHVAYCEDIRLDEIVTQIGTPLYVYSSQAISNNIETIKKAFSSYPTRIHYAVKANNNLSILKEIFAKGLGAEVVSVGELEKVLVAGLPPQRIIFSGVGKKRDELEFAVSQNIFAIFAESEEELSVLTDIASKTGMAIRVGIRLNLDIDSDTHKYIATGTDEDKFGIHESQLLPLIKTYFSSGSLRLVGLSCHFGSQIADVSPFSATARQLASWCEKLKMLGFSLEVVSVGGGFGIRYDQEVIPPMTQFAQAIIDEIRKTKLSLIIEPGRSVIGNAGWILAQVISVKKTPSKCFVVVDASMAELIRPALYNAYHEIFPVVQKPESPFITADIVGPVCESGDFLGKNRRLPFLSANDILAIENCGAYASSMASQYNLRPRPAEVLINGSSFRLVRNHEKRDVFWNHELTLIG